MDLGLGAARTQPAGKGQKRTSGDARLDHQWQDSIVAIVSDIAKLSLSNAQASRIAKSIIMETCRISADGPSCNASMEAIKKFTTRAKTLQADRSTDTQQIMFDEVGLPPYHVFNAILAVTKETLSTLQGLPGEEEALRKDHLQNVEDLIKHVEALQSMKERWMFLSTTLKHMRVVKSFDKKHRKIEVSIDRSQTALVANAWNASKFMLQKSDKNFKSLIGQAPAGALERSIQAYLNGMGEAVEE